jgi:hypothetical protein
VAVSPAALVLAPILVFASTLDPLEGFGQLVLSVQAPFVSAFIPVGLWMGALLARRSWTRGVLLLSTLLLIFLAAWAVWNYLENLGTEASMECLLIESSAPEIADQFDAELCNSLTNGELAGLRRWSWAGFAALWIAPLFVLYFFRRRINPEVMS